MTARPIAQAILALVVLLACLPANAGSLAKPAPSADAKAMQAPGAAGRPASTASPGSSAQAGPAPATPRNGAATAAEDDLDRRLGEETLKKERQKLQRLEAELERIQRLSKPVKPKAAPKPKPETKPGPKDGAADPQPQFRSAAAADVLFRLGRLEEALAAYTAAADAPDVAAHDRLWALVQAGNCCRRLKKFDKAIEAYQTARQEHPDHPWSREGGHIQWAAKAVEWQKRWQRLETGTGD